MPFRICKAIESLKARSARCLRWIEPPHLRIGAFHPQSKIQNLSSHWGADVEECPEKPGIYAWFLPDKAKIIKAIGRFLITILKANPTTTSLQVM